MEEIKSNKDKFEWIKVGIEEITEYKSLSGKIFSSKKECELADKNYITNQEINKFKSKYQYKEINNLIFDYVLIYVENYTEIEIYHDFIFKGNYMHRKWENNDAIQNEWISYTWFDGGDGRDYVEYYRVIDILKDVEELKKLLTQRDTMSSN